MLAKSPRAGRKHHQLLSSLVFAVLGVMLTYGAFSNAVVLDKASEQVVKQILAQERWILTGGIVLAVAEVLAFHKPRNHAETGKR